MTEDGTHGRAPGARSCSNSSKALATGVNGFFEFFARDLAKPLRALRPA